MLATLIPTVMMTALGIVLLAVGSESLNLNLVAGVLLVAFCTTSLTGYILGSIFVSRGASLARVQNDFVSLVSHELRTPLTSIRMFIETLRDDRVQEPTQRKKCLDLLTQEVARLEGLVTRVIELSRIETGRRVFDRERVRLVEVIADAKATLDAVTIASPVKLRIEVDDQMEVVGDRSTLSLALANLLINAYKYSSEPRQIEIRVRAFGDRDVEISVRDNGTGIPREEQERIFGQFERGQGALDHRTPGSGLGLAIVRAIVKVHRGKLELDSKPGRGSEFRIRLRRKTTGGE